MSAAVVDASAVAALLIEPRARGGAVATVLRGRVLSAPALLSFEVAQVLRRSESAGLLPEEDAVDALASLLQLQIELVPFAPLAARGWELRRNLTAYDAAYAALAELRGAPLITLDARLARAPGIRCETIVPT